MKPTSQQEAIWAAIEARESNLMLQARAGCGKTTTIVQGLDHISPDESALFLAFGREDRVALERKVRRPNTMKATTHSYGLAQIRNEFGYVEVDAKKAVKLAMKATRSKNIAYAAAKLADLLRSQLRSTSAEARRLAARYGIEYDGERELAEIVSVAQYVLTESAQQTDTVDHADMIWLPVELELPLTMHDRVFVDETQDLTPVQLELVRRTVKPSGRLIAVGDDRQCQPPGTMIQLDTHGTRFAPIESLRDGDHIAAWNRHSQKMIGGRKIALAARPFNGFLFDVGVGNRRTSVTENHKFIVRWSDRTSTDCVTYLMWRDGFGFRVGWCQLFANKTLHLSHRARMEKADRVWILAVHSDRTSASVYESIVAARYGIPTATFEPVRGAAHLTATSIATIFGSVDTRLAGRQALADHNRVFEYPLYPWPEEDGQRRTRKTLFKVHACNLLPDYMSVPIPEGAGQWARITSIDRTYYRGSVYSLDVDKDHSYAADGIVTLNSIYRWRGAHPSGMQMLSAVTQARELPLSASFRCPQRVIAEAQKLVPDIVAVEGAAQGEVRHLTLEQAVREAEYGDVFVSRLNAPLVRITMELLRDGCAASMLGSSIGAGLAGLVYKMRAQSVTHLKSLLETWATRQAGEILRDDPEALDAAADVRDRAAAIIAIAASCSNVREVADKIKRMFSDDGNFASRVTLASTHKAKGKEWDRVYVLRDTYMRRQTTEEANLLYVAITRAKKELVYVTE